MNSKDKINQLKRVFDKHKVKRMNFEDSFFLDLINAVESKEKTHNQEVKPKTKKIDIQSIRSEKMELMVNIEGICNNLKGKTVFNRYSFGLDIRKVPLRVFLTEAKLLIRGRDFQKSDIIAFYDDSLLRTGNRGFGITRDEIITNSNGIFRVLRFMEMEHEPEYVVGHKKDAFRIHIDGRNYDMKVNKNIQYSGTVLDLLNLLYQYAQIIKEENKKRIRR